MALAPDWIIIGKGSSARGEFLDELFAYQTQKVLKVRDRRLGILNLLFKIGITVYVFWNLITSGLYLIKTNPIGGAVRFNLAAPLNISTYPTPSYCNASSSSTNINYTTNGCLWWTPEQIAIYEESAIFVTTKVTMYTTPPPPAGCNYLQPSSIACMPPRPSSLTFKSYYIAYAENHTLQIDHSVRGIINGNLIMQATVPTHQGSSWIQAMTGKLVAGCNTDGKVLLTFDINSRFLLWNYMTNRWTGDSIPISTLLDGCNCTGVPLLLDANNTMISGSYGEPLRSTGVIISMPIVYTNPTYTMSTEIDYSYIPAAVDGEQFSIMQTQYNTSDGSITYIERNGIKIFVAQGGEIGQFSFLQTLSALVGGTALLSVAQILVEFIMTRILPERKLYEEAKVTNTDQFKEIRLKRKEIREQEPIAHRTLILGEMHD
ncbi:hypothetical protein SmJEL517_g03021 [Synchytrium microbalum]|uniref:Uncharacterized protein n=1 Tax=Synchytrium microbalum TaxID=1806994 RepID=A0A507BZX3_9FUNG|nr:uncharacterized protein SmJEL517_g03021 [Synchytrium microbalum]TPX34357.1 hypothetical protein SmJEL517_g03021 [Synchytrium microbalum]